MKGSTQGVLWLCPIFHTLAMIFRSLEIAQKLHERRKTQLLQFMSYPCPPGGHAHLYSANPQNPQFIYVCMHSSKPNTSPPHLSQSSQSKGTDNSQTQHSLSRPNNLLILEQARCIPSQMSNAIEAVICEWEGDQEFGRNLGGHRPARKRRCHRCTIHGEAHQRGGEVCEAENVETA